MELPRKDIWYIDPEGAYLSSVFQDVRGIIIEHLAWFDQFDGPAPVMSRLEATRQAYAKEGLWDNGEKPSPHWRYHAGYVALWLNNHELALKYFNPVEELILSDNVKKQLLKDIKMAENMHRKLNKSVHADAE